MISLLDRRQSQKTQGFCVADFATLSDETRSRSKIFPLFILVIEPCVQKFERLERSKLLGISQTKGLCNLFEFSRQRHTRRQCCRSLLTRFSVALRKSRTVEVVHDTETMRGGESHHKSQLE